MVQKAVTNSYRLGFVFVDKAPSFVGFPSGFPLLSRFAGDASG